MALNMTDASTDETDETDEQDAAGFLGDTDDELEDGAERDDEDDGDDDEADDDDSSDDESDDEDDDEADLREQIASLERKLAQVEAANASTARNLGQIKSLQSKIDRLSNSAADRESVEGLGELLGALSDALPSLMDSQDPAYVRIAQIQQKRQQADAVREAVNKAREEAGDTGDTADDDGTGNQMSPEEQAAWNTASGLVGGYAKAKGVELDAEFFQSVMRDSSGLPERAIDLAYERIDAKVKTSTKTSSRQRRKDAGRNGSGAPKGGGGGKRGRLTMDDLAGMTQEQIMALPSEEVDRVLAGGR